MVFVSAPVGNSYRGHVWRLSGSTGESVGAVREHSEAVKAVEAVTRSETIAIV